jgi:hypothetical protein
MKNGTLMNADFNADLRRKQAISENQRRQSSAAISVHQRAILYTRLPWRGRLDL